MPTIVQMTPRWVRAPVRGLLWRYRLATAEDRVLPDAVIVGAQKSGTTSLHFWLAQHPQLLPSSAKEVHYFDGGLDPREDTFAKGEPWYRAHFPRRAAVGPDRRAFEASPAYLLHPLVPQRAHALLPHAKLIAVLRNPTHRAISHWFHVRRAGHEPLPIAEALRAEEHRLRPVWEARDFANPSFRQHSYKSRGHYAEQLARWLALYPRERLLVLGSERFFAAPHETLARVFEFLGVDPSFQVPDLVPHNVAGNRSDVDPDVYAYLDDYFRPHNEALFALLGERFDW